MPIRPSDLDRVKALPLFAQASDELFRDMLGGGFLQKFPAGTTLLTEGDPVDFLYILLEGAVELEGTWNDKATTLAVLKPVSAFILAAVVLDSNGLMSAHTLESSQILMVSGEALRRAMMRDARFCFTVAQELAGCYRGVVRALKNQKLRGGMERLANYLISQQARCGGGETFALPHEKRVLASLLGMTPENLSRAFASLGDYGVSVSGPNVTIHRPVVLQRLAKPDALIDQAGPTGDTPASAAELERWTPEPARAVS
ncbi:transcriptional activator FtrB [Phenylobacterium soli]|uniref:Transcriptional regulator n=1 Tax=Phenylobacterium soli TaxID=2170551 RepID=A0A328AL90_9CAUL|nr:cyclic nucleotide-binding domain-containing protein [Phenylobacterium soli]RAK55155.1 transcriptional regulator [Phenylobacterium soli]